MQKTEIKGKTLKEDNCDHSTMYEGLIIVDYSNHTPDEDLTLSYKTEITTLESKTYFNTEKYGSCQNI